MNIAAIGGLIGAIVAVLGGLATWITASATKAKTVADTYGEAIDRLRDDAEEDRAELKALRAAQKEQAAHSIEQDAAIARLQAELSRALGNLHDVYAWIEAGAAPPPPARPAWLTRYYPTD